MKSMVDISNPTELREFMSEPTEGLIEMMSNLDGDIMVIGGDGKVGPELVQTLVKADERAGTTDRDIMVSGLFVTDAAKNAREHFEDWGVKCFVGDLTNDEDLAELPVTKNMVYMIGFKFGSSDAPAKALLLNAILPMNIACKYAQSNIVNFSSGNPYPHTDPAKGGATEETELNPVGVYGHSILARETAYNTSAHGHPEQKVTHYRLMYAQHLGYGVLVDLARMIDTGEAISLEMPYVNLISQRDAIDRALRGFEIANNPPQILNVAGPIVEVREICNKLGEYLGKEPNFVGEEADTALIANDDYCLEQFGEYRDSVDEMIEAAAKWVEKDGEYWELPTMFGKADHQY
ncbi:MAG: NAD-dependent epimerase/dehydratase family protein [Armatimonadota bacterium]